MTRWKIVRSVWGYSLLHDDELVASADDWPDLVACCMALDRQEVEA